TLVAQPVGEARLPKEAVELGLLFRRNLLADCGDLLVDAARLLQLARDGDPNGADKRIRHLDRARLGDVEAIEQPVADQIEVAGDGRTGLTGLIPQAREHASRLVVR